MKLLDYAKKSELTNEEKDDAIALIDSVDDPKELNLCFVNACKNGHNEIVSLIVKKDIVDVNNPLKPWDTAINWASKYGKYEVVKTLIESQKLNLNDPNNYKAFHAAAGAGYKDIVQLFIDAGLDVNIKDKNGKTPFYHASQNYSSKDTKNAVVLELLINRGADVNSGFEGFTGKKPLIHNVIDTKNVHLLELLIEKGVDVNCKDFNGYTPIVCAMNSLIKNSKIIKSLLKSNRCDLASSKTDILDYCYNGIFDDSQMMNYLFSRRDVCDLFVNKFKKEYPQYKDDILNAIEQKSDVHFVTFIKKAFPDITKCIAKHLEESAMIEGMSSMQIPGTAEGHEMIDNSAKLIGDDLHKEYHQ